MQGRSADRLSALLVPRESLRKATILSDIPTEHLIYNYASFRVTPVSLTIMRADSIFEGTLVRQNDGWEVEVILRMRSGRRVAPLNWH